MFLQICLPLELICSAWLGAFCAVFAWIRGCVPVQTLIYLLYGALYMFLHSIKSIYNEVEVLHISKFDTTVTIYVGKGTNSSRLWAMTDRKDISKRNGSWKLCVGWSLKLNVGSLCPSDYNGKILLGTV